MLIIFSSLSALRKLFILFENTHKIENSHYRSLSTTYSTQLEFFKKIWWDISHWSVARIFRTLLSAWEQNTFVSNLYRKNTTKATKMCFYTAIVNTSSYPTLHSFPPTSLGRLLPMQFHYLISRPRILQYFQKIFKKIEEAFSSDIFSYCDV